MTEPSFSKPTNDSPFFRNEPVNYTTGIFQFFIIFLYFIFVYIFIFKFFMNENNIL